MFDIKKIVRPNILKLTPYASARDEFQGKARIALDANENPYGSINSEPRHRYPDPKHSELRERLSTLKGISKEKIFVGNGSDEAIDLLIRIFCRPGEDSILTLHPSYPMYKVSADINDIATIQVNLNEDYSLNPEPVIGALSERIKIVFLCNPNNPTGNAFEPDALRMITKRCLEREIICVVDEAYIDFCPDKTLLHELSRYPNLVILQTLSKAWGLAEARVGICCASEEIVSFLYKVKAPYNVNGISQKIALTSLEAPEEMESLARRILSERARLAGELLKLDSVVKVYPSDANFLFVKMADAALSFSRLMSDGIVVRDRSSVQMCEGCFRITVGTEAENDALIAALKGEDVDPSLKSRQNAGRSGHLSQRVASVSRKTAETNIEITLNLDGSGTSSITTGIGFFDHMLTQIARHGAIDMQLSVKGDLQVDEHHTIEDTALALGECFLKALGDKRGIERYSFMLPMDESIAHVALDLSGRSHLEWCSEFKREKIGEMPTEMFKHFFKAFCDSSKSTLHIKADGENEHHKIEAIFKAFAQCLKIAARRVPGRSTIPSSKEVL